MHTIKRELYSFLDSWKLEMNIFKTQGIIILAVAIAKSVLAVLTIITATTMLGYLYEIGIIPYGMNFLLEYLGGRLFILLLPLLLVFAFTIFIEIKAGLVAKDNWDKPENKEEVLKWAKYYIIYIIFSLLLSFNVGSFLYGTISVLLNLLSAAFYFYFSQRLAAMRVDSNSEVS